MEEKVMNNVSASSDTKVGVKEPTAEATNYQNKSETTQNALSIPTINVSSQISQKNDADTAGSKLEGSNAASFSDAEQDSATIIASFWRCHRKSRENKGKILSAKSRDKHKRAGGDKVCMHLSDNCPAWTHWKELLEAIEERIRMKSMMNELPSTNQKLGIAISVVERIAKGAAKNQHLWLILDTEHWLEICDNRHRYGANLKVYHDYWLSTNTPENFFYWLDEGNGKDLSIPGCERSLVERQRVKYLTREERLDYEVIFKDGLLIYKKSEKPVHTNPPSIDGVGSSAIASLHASEASENDTGRPSSPTPSSTGSLNENDTSHLTHKRYDSGTNGVREKWIYVTDCQGRFYVGRKIKGHFHHSSFLAGGAICAAGGIKVREGELISINPNSGHYKPAQRHFKALIERLSNNGVNISNVKVVYPDDLTEQRLMAKYKVRRVAQLKMMYNAFGQDVEQAVNQQFDSVDRYVTKTSHDFKKNIELFLREGKETLREWFDLTSSDHKPLENDVNHNRVENNTGGSDLLESNGQPTSDTCDKKKIKVKHERKFSGFLQEIFTGVALFFTTPLDQKNTVAAKKDNEHNELVDEPVNLSSESTVQYRVVA
ncbi:3931_t:CDS:2 [Acaulospora morrowiae]|uniref:3931_t:CDS:1 n=1 Tax=Acaulospora morrowiae TaxID=94023 RepID=A0A9N9HGB8_9GLOM|nr:3931_t:CDS:2 [Acaulospora morrowiae]